MAIMTVEPWNKAFRAILFEPYFGIRISFLEDRAGPGLKAKHVVWALDDLFDILVEHDRYEIGSFYVNSNWDEGRMALGSVVVPGVSDPVPVKATDERLHSLANSTLDNAIMNSTMSDRNGTVSLGLHPDFLDTISTLDQKPVSFLPALNLSSRVDHIDLTYRPNGAEFHDIQIYNASLKLLVRISEITNQQQTIWPMISTYNDMDDFTMTARPANFVKRSQLTWHDASQVIGYFAYYMSSQGGPQGRWAEVEGVVKTSDGLSLGVVCIEKGEKKEKACGFSGLGWS